MKEQLVFTKIYKSQKPKTNANIRQIQLYPKEFILKNLSDYVIRLFELSSDCEKCNLVFTKIYKMRKFILRIMNETKNTVLITSKANLKTTHFLCKNLSNFKDRIRFMITITTDIESIALEYEPGAPLIFERFECLRVLSKNNWSFNVSIEPFLDSNPIELIKKILQQFPSVNSIWLGANSRKNMKQHCLCNLSLIMKTLRENQELSSKVFLKNSFLDKFKNY